MREPGLPVGPAGTLWSPAAGVTCGGALGITALHQAGQAQALTGRFGQSQPAGPAPSPITVLCKVARQREAETRVCLQRPPLTIPQTPSLPSFPPRLFQNPGACRCAQAPRPQPAPCAEAGDQERQGRLCVSAAHPEGRSLVSLGWLLYLPLEGARPSCFSLWGEGRPCRLEGTLGLVSLPSSRMRREAPRPCPWAEEWAGQGPAAPRYRRGPCPLAVVGGGEGPGDGCVWRVFQCAHQPEGCHR